TAITYLELFLLELMRESNSVKRATQENPIAKKNLESTLVESIKEYMQENVYCTLTLNCICEHFHMSKSYICQLFKTETGHSVIDYFIELKMKEAKLLIREGELNFTQIAEKLGYSSLHHFTRIFKSREKMSPSSYEKSIKGL
ncbi:MAG: helix-turn-helix transcriptional regulator, partial [Eubacteriales bacterium]